MVMIVAEPHPMTLRTLYLSMGSLTRLGRYRSKTVLCRLLNSPYSLLVSTEKRYRAG
jgi:hypothetical protein